MNGLWTGFVVAVRQRAFYFLITRLHFDKSFESRQWQLEAIRKTYKAKKYGKT